jgi:hypothetical protein
MRQTDFDFPPPSPQHSTTVDDAMPTGEDMMALAASRLLGRNPSSILEAFETLQEISDGKE